MRMKCNSTRALQFALLSLAVFVFSGASDPSTRFNEIGHRMMCICGCNQILLECNHVGCPDSGPMIAKLRQQIDAGTSEPAILDGFVAEYGPTVLAAPLRGGFDIVAWVVPFAVLVLGGMAILLVLRRWRRGVQPVAAAPSPTEDALRERIRRDTDQD